MKKLILLFGICLLMLSSVSALNDTYAYYDFANYEYFTLFDNSDNEYDIATAPQEFFNSDGTTFIDFNDNNNYFDPPFNFLSDNLYQEYTVAVWLNITDITAGTTWVLGGEDWNTIYMNDQEQIRVNVRGAGGTSEYYPSNALPNSYGDGENHLVIFGTDGVNAYLQIDNGAVLSYTDGTSTAQSSFRVGARDSGSVIYYNGSVANLGVWNRTLTPSERTTLYNGGTPINPYDTNPITQPFISLDPLFRFDGTNNGSHLIDVTGNGYDSLISGVSSSYYEQLGYTFYNFTNNNFYYDIPIEFENGDIDGDYAVTFLVDTNALNSTLEYIFGNNDWERVTYSDGQIAARVRGASSGVYQFNNSDYLINDDDVHFIVYGKRFGEGFLNVDNKGEYVWLVSNFFGQLDVALGARGEGTPFTNVDVAEFTFYNNSLSVANQTFLYNQLLNGTPTPPTPINNTYSSFIEFELNDSNTFFDTFGVSDLELTSGILQQVSAGLRGTGVSLANAQDYRISGLDNITNNNHTVSYWLRFQVGTPTFTNRLIGDCELQNNGDYYCGGVLVYPFNDNSLIMFTHVYDSDSDREYIYQSVSGGEPNLLTTFIGSNTSTVMNNNNFIDFGNQNYAGFKADELVVYPNTLSTGAIKSLNVNGSSNNNFALHPEFIGPQPPSSVSYLTPFTNLTVNSTGVNYNVNHTIASGDTPINYISSLEKGIINVFLTNSLNNDIVVSLNNSMFIANGYYDVVILSNNSEGNNRSVFSNRLFICESNYEAVYSSCVNDTQIKTYNDLASCNPSYDVPSDNGTSVVCDDGILSSSEITQAELDIKQENSYLLMIAILLILLIGVKYLVNVGGLFGAVFSLFIAMIGVYTFTLFSSPLVPIVIIIVGVIMLLIDVTKIRG